MPFSGSQISQLCGNDEYTVCQVSSTEDTSSMSQEVLNITLFKEGKYAPDHVSKLQRKDLSWKTMYSYLSHGTLPDSPKEGRRLILQGADYSLIDGMLLHSSHPRSKHWVIIS